MKAIMFEGSPEEVVQALTAMQAVTPNLMATTAVPVAPTEEIEESEKEFVTVDMARKVFKRRPLSEEQRKVVKVLFKNHPEWTPITDLHAAVDYTPAQFAGLLGAFGRRLSHTEGYIPGSWLFDAEWDESANCWAYKLPETTYEAVKLEKIA